MLQKLRSYLKNAIHLIIAFCVTLVIIGYTLPAKADVIYHAFNMPFQEIKNQLPELKADGFTYIQISPPQLSNPSPQWWGRYQPVDFDVLESPLGNENDLKELIDAAHEQDLKIIVDIVLNHMANDGVHSDTLTYPRFSPQDFHEKRCINNYDDPNDATTGWLGCNLPDLNTSSEYVRNEAKRYLTHLLDLGADGFRIDALKHIEPDYFRDVLSVVPNDKYIYGELISGDPNQAYAYTGIHGIDVTDYPLLNNLKGAFGFGGDLRSLISPQNVINSENAVTFSKTHDTIPDNGRCEGLCAGYNFDSRDQMLANGYLLGRAEGMPLMFRDDAGDPIVQGGANFHEKMMGQPQYFRNGNDIYPGSDSPNILFIERGNQGLAIINKAGEPFAPPSAKMPGLDEGCYDELTSGSTMCVHFGDDGNKYVESGLSVPGRSAVFSAKK